MVFVNTSAIRAASQEAREERDERTREQPYFACLLSGMVRGRLLRNRPRRKQARKAR